jgi:polyisoprenyl-phosphate glycosyltransferase
MTIHTNCEISLVIPVYNEGDHLLQSLAKIEEEIQKSSSSYEIIIIDDGSTDGSWKLLEDFLSITSNIVAFKLSKNFGKECAIVAGLEYASGQAVIIMDGDLQHPPHLIEEMIYIWRTQRVDIVEGIKKERGQENIRYQVGTTLFYYILKKFTGYQLNGSSDFKLLDRKVIESWKQMPERNTFFRGMTAWLGFKRVKIKFDVANRVYGERKWSMTKLTKLALNAVISFSSLPLRFVSIVGILFFIASLLLGVQTIIQKLNGNALSGFTTVILLQLIIGSVFMISLGVIGEYIAAIYNEVKGRPRYVIEDRITSKKNTHSRVKDEI